MLDYTALKCVYDLNLLDPSKFNDDPDRNDGTASGAITDGALIRQGFNAVPGHSNYVNTQETSGLRPAYRTTGGVGGIPWLQASISNSGKSFPLPAQFLTDLNAAPSGKYWFAFLFWSNNTGGTYQILGSNIDGADGKYFFAKNINGQNATRYNSGLNSPVSTGELHAYILTFDGNGEIQYFDSPLNPQTNSINTALNGNSGGVFDIGSYLGGHAFENGGICRVMAGNDVLSNVQVAQILAEFNDTAGTSFDTSAGPLTAGAISASSLSQTGFTVLSGAALGGSGEKSYQWLRGLHGASRTPVSGATSLSFVNTGLVAQTGYDLQLRVTDGVGTVALSSVLTVTTHGTTTLNIDDLGDSIDALSPAGVTIPQSYQDQLVAAYPGFDPETVNRAAAGQRMHEIAQNITLTVAAMVTRGTQVVNLMAGTNDASEQFNGTSGYTDAQFTADLAAIRTAVTGAGIRLYVHQIPFREPSGTDAIVQRLNAIIAAQPFGGLYRQGDTTIHAAWMASPTATTYLGSDMLHPNGVGVIDAAARRVAATGASLAADFLTPPDVTAPTVIAATLAANGTTLTITLSEACNGSTGFTAKVAGSPRSSTPSGSGTTRTLELATPAGAGQTVTLDYSPGNIVDLAGNALVAFTAFSVTNNSTVDITPPVAPVLLRSGSTLQFYAAVERDAVSIRFKRDGVTKSTVSIVSSVVPSWTDGAAAAGESYVYTATALDAAGNESGASNSITVNIPGANEFTLRVGYGLGDTPLDGTFLFDFVPLGAPAVRQPVFLSNSLQSTEQSFTLETGSDGTGEAVLPFPPANARLRCRPPVGDPFYLDLSGVEAGQSVDLSEAVLG